MWEKYEYILNNPTKIKSLIWWQNFEENAKVPTDILYCSPFIIKILNKENLSCIKCPWYRFCTGCILDPFIDNEIIINPTQIIVLEWCHNLIKQEINETNIRLILNHESVKNKLEDKNVKTLDECINLFLEKEHLDEEDQQIYCRKCKSQRNFYKKYDFDKTPPVLILSIKRFKFAKMYKKKIDNLIDFPLYDLEIKGNKYDLYGVINHTGVLSGGHYTAILKYNNKWIKCDDSNCYEIGENTIVTPGAYILVYKLKQEITTDYFRLMNYIINNLDLHVQSVEKNNIPIQNYYDTIFVQGEPVNTIYGKGYVCKEIIRGEQKIIHVKFRYGHGYLNIKSVLKEIKLEVSFPNFHQEINLPVKNTSNTILVRDKSNEINKKENDKKENGKKDDSNSKSNCLTF